MLPIYAILQNALSIDYIWLLVRGEWELTIFKFISVLTQTLDSDLK